jgi:hypothetical protein
MTSPSRYILLNSTIAFVAAFLLTTLIHESGHFFAYLIAGAHPTLYHNYVQAHDDEVGRSAGIIAALAGPGISLLQGILAGLFVSRKQRNGWSSLVLLWMALLGFVNCFGYLMMTPLSTVGDTGKAAELLDVGHSLRITVAVIGAAALFWTILRLGRNFSNFIPAGESDAARVRYIYRIMYVPIIIGSVVNTLLALPAPALLSIIYPATSSWVIMSSFGVIKKSRREHPGTSEIEQRIHPGLVILLCAGILVNRILAYGAG